ncbi:MAG: hypothetical protein U9P38_05345 [Campylobacterota bacterium]|nr:hypothetical protein [Campylobacterota bacterium]
MLKIGLEKALFAIFFMTTTLMGGDYTFESNSLVGIEGGFSRISNEVTIGNDYSVNKDNGANIALKIGGQTRNYRLYLNARYYMDFNDKFDYITTYGAEGQYIFNITSGNDFFIGVEGGILNMKFQLENEKISRTISDPYLGAGAGFGFDVGESFYLELGTRILNVDAINTNNNISYQFNNIISAYMSVVVKYHMD